MRVRFDTAISGLSLQFSSTYSLMYVAVGKIFKLSFNYCNSQLLDLDDLTKVGRAQIELQKLQNYFKRSDDLVISKLHL